jgi:cold shock CspA family protein
VFCHVTDLLPPLVNLVEGQTVEFDIVPSRRRAGQNCAAKVRVI